jgi:hypothetical protein
MADTIQLYVYALRNRPPGYGNMPDGAIAFVYDPLALTEHDLPDYGTVTYDRPLPPQANLSI